MDAFAPTDTIVPPTSGEKRGRSPSYSQQYNRIGQLALHNAVRRYDVVRLKQLVEAGHELTEVDYEGRNPLHLAVIAARPGADAVHKMITIMLSAAAEDLAEAMCSEANDGLTPMHLAASGASSTLMEALLGGVEGLEKIGMVSVDDVLEMRTSLRGELWNGNWGKKAAGGKIEQLDTEHMTLLHVALERLDQSEREDEEGGDEDTAPLSDAARAEAIQMVRLLIRRGSDVNAVDANGRAPIHQAVLAGLPELAELLLEAGADPSMGCKAIGMTNTVLHQAVLQGDVEMVRLLLRTAPHLDVDAAGQNGMTPLCLAARTNKQACAEALVEGGAEPRKIVTSFGKSALDIARTNKRSAILRLFGEEAS